jgi:hypothetical protein
MTVLLLVNAFAADHGAGCSAQQQLAALLVADSPATREACGVATSTQHAAAANEPARNTLLRKARASTGTLATPAHAVPTPGSSAWHAHPGCV